MRPPSVLTDEFLRALVAIGQVDLLVGLPTFNNAATVKPIAQAVYVAFARYFPRLRTALVNSDGGSADGTPEIVQSVTAQASGEPVSTLRTIHRVATSHASALGKGSALRTVFAAADLTQARTVVVLDPDIASVTPEWIERLARPSLERKMDYVAPVYARGPFEGPLVRHIVRPVFQAVYGVPMREPVGGEFACSGRFAAHCLRRSVWNLAFTRYGMDIWLAGEAVAGGFEVAEAALGPRTPMRTSGRLGLAELIAYVVGALFTCLELHEGHWTSDPAPRDLPSFGTLDAVRPDGAPPASEARGDLARDVADLRPILQSCLESETLAALQRAAAGDDAIGDELWARLLGDFMLAHARQSIGRDHLLQALVPLYRDRVAAFVETHRHDGPAAVEAAFERLAAACLRLRPSWIERWHQ